MSCPDCEFFHDVSRNIIKMVGDLNSQVYHLMGVAAQNRVWADREASRKIRRLERQLEEARRG